MSKIKMGFSRSVFIAKEKLLLYLPCSFLAQFYWTVLALSHIINAFADIYDVSVI